MKLNDRLFETVYLILKNKKVTISELSEKFDVTTRTIYRDIEVLTSNGVPIYYTKGRDAGIGLIDNFDIDDELLESKDREKIFQTLKGMNNFSGEKDTDALEKMSILFNKKINDWISVDYTSRNTTEEASEKFNKLKSAILNKKVIYFEYCERNGEVDLKVAEPLQIWYKNDTWYLYTYLKLRKEYRLFKITRIKKVIVTTEHFKRSIPPYKSKVENTPAIVVKLAISKEMGERVFDEFDVEEITMRPDDNFIVNVKLPKNDEIYNYILSFGEYVKVLEPPEVQEEIKQKTKKIFKNYI